MHSKPKPHQGHTITWRSSLRFLISLEREKQQHKWHMVRTKSTPQQAEVRPLKCIVYITRNPVTFVIQWRRDLFLLDQQARDQKHHAAYKRHVHLPPTTPAVTTTAKNSTYSGRDKASAIHRWRQQFS